MSKKLIAPYIVKIETSNGYRSSDPMAEDCAYQAATEAIEKCQTLGYTQVKTGAYLYSHADHGLTWRIKVFNALGSLVTHELLSR